MSTQTTTEVHLILKSIYFFFKDIKASLCLVLIILTLRILNLKIFLIFLNEDQQNAAFSHAM